MAIESPKRRQSAPKVMAELGCSYMLMLRLPALVLMQSPRHLNPPLMLCSTWPLLPPLDEFVMRLDHLVCGLAKYLALYATAAPRPAFGAHTIGIAGLVRRATPPEVRIFYRRSPHASEKQNAGEKQPLRVSSRFLQLVFVHRPFTILLSNILSQSACRAKPSQHSRMAQSPVTTPPRRYDQEVGSVATIVEGGG